jgi:predicted TIM-barrel fold metal-dependent hydrolase
LSEAYGAHRMIYGGGFNANATPASYRAAYERVRGYLAHLKAEDQAQVLGLTAAKLFGFAS